MTGELGNRVTVVGNLGNWRSGELETWVDGTGTWNSKQKLKGEIRTGALGISQCGSGSWTLKFALGPWGAGELGKRNWTLEVTLETWSHKLKV